MKKTNIIVVVALTVIATMVAGGVKADLIKSKTNATDDRRAQTNSAVESAEVLKQILAEIKKSNELLAKIAGVSTGSSAAPSPMPGGITR